MRVFPLVLLYLQGAPFHVFEVPKAWVLMRPDKEAGSYDTRLIGLQRCELHHGLELVAGSGHPLLVATASRLARHCSAGGRPVAEVRNSLCA